MRGFSSNQESLKTEDPKKVSFVVMPMYDYRPVLEHSLAIFSKIITTLDNNRLFITDVYASKSLTNPSYMGQLKNELYFSKWRFAINATMMKQVNLQATSNIGLPGEQQFGTELNMGYLQGYAKRKLAKGFYAGAGMEWTFMGNYTMSLSELDAVNFNDVGIEMKMIQPLIMFEFDSRDNAVYPTSGVYITNQTNFISDSFGSKLENIGPGMQPVLQKDYFFGKNYLKAKAYHSFDGTWRSVLAAQYMTRAGLGDVPVSMWENANNWIRGYTEGKNSGKQLHFLEVEWRKYVTDRIGFVTFGSLGFVGEKLNDTFSKDGLVPAAGAGFRFRVMKSNPVAFRVDYAVGRNGESSIYFGLSEYF
jgi:outer membrane protein assembly factor BamA